MKRWLAMAILCGALGSAGSKALATTESTDLTESVSASGPRAGKDLGLGFGLNDPMPALFGFNVALDVLPFLRITAGIGRFSSDVDYGGTMVSVYSLAYAVGTRFLVPQWRLTPIVGVSWGSIKTEGFDAETRHVYFTAGLEWQSHRGLTLGAGFSRSTDRDVGGLPYANVGWQFDAW